MTFDLSFFNFRRNQLFCDLDFQVCDWASAVTLLCSFGRSYAFESKDTWSSFEVDSWFLVCSERFSCRFALSHFLLALKPDSIELEWIVRHENVRMQQAQHTFCSATNCILNSSQFSRSLRIAFFIANNSFSISFSHLQLSICETVKMYGRFGNCFHHFWSLLSAFCEVRSIRISTVDFNVKNLSTKWRNRFSTEVLLGFKTSQNNKKKRWSRAIEFIYTHKMFSISRNFWCFG